MRAFEVGERVLYLSDARTSIVGEVEGVLNVVWLLVGGQLLHAGRCVLLGPERVELKLVKAPRDVVASRRCRRR